MSLTSYATNFEDVLLWRALQHVGRGHYLDVGAGSPDAGSVTELFYQHGWSGINLQAARAPFQQLLKHRPADINLQVAASHQSGTAPRYEVADTGLATFDAELAQQYRAAGQDVVIRTTSLQTLDQICEQYLSTPLHFVHIAAQASEVLAGFDLARWQPWLVLVPANDQDSAAALRAAAYTLAYQDGWKHYYVSSQHSALATSLVLPPHPADQFMLCEDHPRSFPLADWRARCAAAEAEAVAMRDWAKQRGDTLEAELARVQQVSADQANALENDRAHYLEQRAHLEQRLSAEQARAQHAEQQLPHLQARSAAADHAEATLSGVYASLSWRLTRPLRSANLLAHRSVRFARQLPGRLRHAVISRIKRVLGGTLRFINRHPRLSFFLRRSVSRLPSLLPLARALHLRMKLSQANAAGAAQAQAPADAGAAPDLSQLPEAAHRMFDDLRRSAFHP